MTARSVIFNFYLTLTYGTYRVMRRNGRNNSCNVSFRAIKPNCRGEIVLAILIRRQTRVGLLSLLLYYRISFSFRAGPFQTAPSEGTPQLDLG